jgi:hypothetical protein
MDAHYTNNVRLSVVIRVVGGSEFLRDCLEQLILQIEGQPIEVIVPFYSFFPGIDTIQKDFPKVIFTEINDPFTINENLQLRAGQKHSLYDLCTARGLKEAKGEIIALLEDYGIPNPDWCAQVIEAHRLPYAVIGGAIEHTGQGILNWAVYFLDFGRYQPPLKEGPAQNLTDINISYKRENLESIRDIWQNEYNEVIVNWALLNHQHVLWLRPQIIVNQNRDQLYLKELIAERFYWGLIFGRKRAQQSRIYLRLVYFLLCPLLPFVFITRLAIKVFTGKRNRQEFIQSLPFIFILAIPWSLGEMVGTV